jgi:FG-GAP repeat
MPGHRSLHPQGLRRLSPLVGALVVGLALSVPLPGHGPTASALVEECGPSTRSDFNGDGFPDVAVADPTATVDGSAGAGRVVVSYGTGEDVPGGGGTAVISQDTADVGGAAEPDDHFGAALSVADLDCDSYADLVVGVPGEDAGGDSNAGLVQVIWGAADGLGVGRASRTVDQSTFGLRRHAGDELGAAVDAKEHVSQDETETPGALAVGVPGYDVGGHSDAGVVAYEAPDQSSGTISSWFSQDSRGVPGAAEKGDRFGSVVAVVYPAGGEDALGVLVGVPQEDVGSAKDAGAVTYVEGLRGSLSGVGLDQNTSGVPGKAEAGDRFGASVSTVFDGSDTQVAVGVPGEDLGSTKDAGAVQRFTYDSDDFTPEPSLSQGSAGVGDVAEAGDAFGSAVALSEDPDGRTVLAVGSPGEDGSAADTGLVQVFGGKQVAYTQGGLGVGDRTEANDRFGSVLGTIGDSADLLLVGVPDDVQHPDGVVELVALDGARPTRHLVPGSAGVPATGADRFGAAVGTYAA